jgi:hypothetical protein
MAAHLFTLDTGNQIFGPFVSSLVACTYMQPGYKVGRKRYTSLEATVFVSNVTGSRDDKESLTVTNLRKVITRPITINAPEVRVLGEVPYKDRRYGCYSLCVGTLTFHLLTDDQYQRMRDSVIYVDNY